MKAAGQATRAPCLSTSSTQLRSRLAAAVGMHAVGSRVRTRACGSSSSSSTSNCALHSRCSALAHKQQHLHASRGSVAAAAAASSPQPSAAGAASTTQPDLSGIKKAGDLERLLFAQMASQQRGSGDSGGVAFTKPNAPVTPADFVQALEMVVRSTGQAVNPEQLDDIFAEIVSTQLLEQFSPAQLAATTKNLAVLSLPVRDEFVIALLQQLQRQMAAMDAQQLSNVAWGLLRLLPVAEPSVREVAGMDQRWLDTYMAAVQQQLECLVDTNSSSSQDQQQQPDTHQQQQQQQQPQQLPVSKLPSAQQVANLLLLPAAVMQPPAQALVSLLEQVLMLRQHSLCGYAVAQLLTCYVRLSLRPGPLLLDALLAHVQEEWMLYDYDELTQVAFNAYVLQLQLPDTLLADMTQRAQALEQAGQAAASDKAVLQEALQRLAARKAGGRA